jgi:gliding motility-associated-like protein
MDFNPKWKAKPREGHEFIYRYYDNKGKSYIGHTKQSLCSRAGGKSGANYTSIHSKFEEAITQNGFESFEFEIFDRWGESVFFTDKLSEGWDGTFNGKLCDAAVYFYRLIVNCAGGKKFVEGGDITLIR